MKYTYINMIKLQGTCKLEEGERDTKSEEVGIKGILKANVVSSKNPSSQIRVGGGEALETPHKRIVQTVSVVVNYKL